MRRSYSFSFSRAINRRFLCARHPATSALVCIGIARKTDLPDRSRRVRKELILNRATRPSAYVMLSPVTQEITTVSVEQELKLTEDTIEEVKKILTGLQLSGDDWSIIAAGMIHQGIEHHEAIVLLIRNKKIGSAFALTRSVLEILVRGAWFTCCATPADVTKFRDQDKIDLKFGEMCDAIDQSQKIEYFHNQKGNVWKMANSYTHTGILQLGRRWTGDKLAASYKDGEIVEVLRAITIWILLLVQPYLSKNKQDEASKKIVALGQRLLPKQNS